MSGILENFKESIISNSQEDPFKYYSIIKEIAKLKRYELLEFKKRFQEVIEDVKLNRFSLPTRYSSLRTGCGFVLISLMSDKTQYWKNALANFTETYKYKRKLQKCLGVIVFKNGEYFEIYWAFIDKEWKYNKIFEAAVKRESEFYGKGEFKEIDRYKFE